VRLAHPAFAESLPKQYETFTLGLRGLYLPPLPYAGGMFKRGLPYLYQPFTLQFYYLVFTNPLPLLWPRVTNAFTISLPFLCHPFTFRLPPSARAWGYVAARIVTVSLPYAYAYCGRIEA